MRGAQDHALERSSPIEKMFEAPRVNHRYQSRGEEEDEEGGQHPPLVGRWSHSCEQIFGINRKSEAVRHSQAQAESRSACDSCEEGTAPVDTCSFHVLFCAFDEMQHSSPSNQGGYCRADDPAIGAM